MSLAAPRVREGQRVLSGPEKVRSENWWRIEHQGQRFALGQLLPELASDEALRRRYVRDAERRAALDLEGVARVLEVGPAPEPRDPSAEAPWRLRIEPDGVSLAAILAKRAPLPPDEAIALVASLADVVHAVHQAGVVLRDLEPRNIIVDSNGGVCLTEVGLARVDILSTRSASSLMLEGSAYAAPEHLRATVLDSRADIYTLGVILWEALTGSIPFAETGAFFRDRDPLPALASLDIDAPDALDRLIAACLHDSAERRPESARDVADALRGRVELGAEQGNSLALALVVCQACGDSLRPGLRLCLSCGKEAVQFSHADAGDDSRTFEVRLLKAREDTEFVNKLRAFFESVGEGPPPELNFLIGDLLLYSKAERERLHKLPATLISNLTEETAKALAERLKEQGFKVQVARARRKPSRAGRNFMVLGGAAAVAGVSTMFFAPIALGVGLIVSGVAFGAIGARLKRRKPRPRTKPLAELRKAPAALPASDPLIARLGALLEDGLASDVRDRIEEVALLVQRLVDHRAASGDSADIERLTEPVLPIVSLIERETSALIECDAGLSDLDEGTLVRAIATSEARDEPRARRLELYEGLDRLRSLEDRRAVHMERLLEASSLMRRVTHLGLGVKDEETEETRLLAMALAALE